MLASRVPLYPADQKQVEEASQGAEGRRYHPSQRVDMYHRFCLLARVEKVYSGQDGHVRVVDVAVWGMST